MIHLVIAENDHSQWNDVTGKTYHFPKRYLKHFQRGTRLIYYKGKMIDKSFANRRLTKEPHYFGIGEVGEVFEDVNSLKDDYYAQIINFTPFDEAVVSKKDGVYLETIPEAKKKNYWRDGVRLINQVTYNKIVSLAGITKIINDAEQGSEYAYTSREGNSKQVFVTKYERDIVLRKRAIEIHGTTCMACEFDFKKTYGDWGTGFIHVHHIKPLSDGKGERTVNAETDMIVLCPNCHSMVHRRKNTTLSFQELSELIRNAKK
ncbi:HNH endonuclease [Sphingobacterium paludis]|uniref:Putative restriction endonuclease n=1 Tax=Sphingobacterium paludis TaxID=1476465 RepID=A0A4R7D0Q6_9SPHI|nr:HNH endonuclease [Sphingobacterium paludis]TDS12346.1 putative restriction endonuclease [Sphingobacterium paludis]